jgi:hypothetical protein
MLEICRQCQISLNIKKCIFRTLFGILLGHIVCKQGLLLYLAKIAIIVNLPPPKSVSFKRKFGTHRILYEIYKRVCIDHCIDGEIIEKRQQVSME